MPGLERSSIDMNARLYKDYLITITQTQNITHMDKKRTHNYPKKRKPRDTSYSESWKLKDRYGLDVIEQIWKQKGMYGASVELKTSPYVIRYLAHKHEWTRPASNCPAIVKGVINGNAKAEFYKTLNFSGINLNNKTGVNNDK